MVRRPQIRLSFGIPATVGFPRGHGIARCLALVGLLLAGCRAGASGQPAFEFPVLPTGKEQQLSLLGEIRQVLLEDYLYADFGGEDWLPALDDLGVRVQAGIDDDEFGRSLKALLAALPPGTADYLTRQERIAETYSSVADYEGIGAFIAFREEPEPRIVLLSVIRDSPAEQAGLKAHDAIYAIDGARLRAEEGLAAAGRVRGPEGTSVRLEVASPDGSRRVVDVARGRVVARDRTRGQVTPTGSVHLQVPVRADSSLVNDVGIAMEAMAQDPGVDGLVLDLRIAGSDADWPLEELLGLFVSGGQGAFLARNGAGALNVTGRDLGGTQTVPLVVLVGADTSGAPEIFAAAIQARGRGVVVGGETPGRVFGFATQVLSDGSQLTYARSTYRTLRGVDLGATGVSPNIPVEADWDQVTETADPVLRTALDFLTQ